MIGNLNSSLNSDFTETIASSSTVATIDYNEYDHHQKIRQKFKTETLF